MVSIELANCDVMGKITEQLLGDGVGLDVVEIPVEFHFVDVSELTDQRFELGLQSH